MTDTKLHDDCGDYDSIEVPDAFICPITQSLMCDPVVTKYGHSYERSAIVEWIAKGKDCPMSRQPLTLSGIITNHSLRAQIRNWQIKNELDITLITYDPLERVGMLGYFMIPKNVMDETEVSTDDERDIVVREVPRRTTTQTEPAPRRRRRFFLRLFRRGNALAQA